MKVLTVDFTAKNASEQFSRSLKETGFAVLSNHPIQTALIDSVYTDWEKFFASEDKFQYLFDKEKQDGYFPYLSENAKQSPVKDLKEFYHLYSWGRYPSSISESTHQLFDQLHELAVTLLDWIEQHMPAEIRQQLSMPLSQMHQKKLQSVFRVLNYPGLTGDEDPRAIRAEAHEDINLITLLPAATTSGLEVMDVAGHWHQVPCDYGTLAVNTGDMLQLCTQGYYKATTHRVINPEGEDATKARMSLPMFLHPDPEVRLSEKHTQKSYLTERLIEIGLY